MVGAVAWQPSNGFDSRTEQLMYDSQIFVSGPGVMRMCSHLCMFVSKRTQETGENASMGHCLKKNLLCFPLPISKR